MTHDRLTVLTTLIAQGVIPIFSDLDPGVCIGVTTACLRGGAKCVEFTNRNQLALSAFQEIVRQAPSDNGLILGAGSIVDAPTAALFIANGAQFIVSPILNPEIARLCNRRKVAYVPGCATASEISQAEELGCELVKLFPGGSIGPEFVKAILGPMPWCRIMPTGGVEASEASLREWFGAGIAACGMGSDLISKSMVAKKDYLAIQKRVAEIIALVRTIRSESPAKS